MNKSMNPFLQRMGFAATDRVVIVHADDLAMSWATISAFSSLLEHRLVSSGSVMVPCPWFRAFADWRKQHPQADVGVHLTLTSEWSGYRWGPVSTRDPSSGLIDHEGYFHNKKESVVQNAEAEAVWVELRSQLEMALQADIDPTHIDSHMYIGMEPVILPHFARLAFEYRLPAFILREKPGGVLDEKTKLSIRQYEEDGLPIFDNLRTMRHPGSPLEKAMKAFSDLPAGLTCVILHAAVETEELHAILPGWRGFVDDYEAFSSPELIRFVRNQGIIVIGYRELRDEMRRTSLK